MMHAQQDEGGASCIDSPFDRIVALLHVHTETSRGVRARCPAHDDSTPSLDVDRGDDGRVLLKCRAGCTNASVVEAMGLKVRDLFPRDTNHAAQRTPNKKKEKTRHATADKAMQGMCYWHAKRKGKLSRQFDYHDANGLHVMRTMRFDFPDASKQFGQTHRTAEGHWINQGMPSPRPLFRLPELMSADSKEPVLITEGEKCVEVCCASGFVATTSSQGAQSPARTDWSPLRDRDVVVLPDNDKGGREYRDAVIRLVRDAGARSIAVLELEGLGEGQDVADWIQHRTDEGLDHDAIRERLRDLVSKASPAERPLEPETSGSRPEVLLSPGRLREAVDQAESAMLQDSKAERIYQRGTQLARVARVDEPSAPRRGVSMPALAPIIMAVQTTYLRAQFESVAQFMRRDDDGTHPVSCPPDVASCYSQSAGHWKVPVLRAIVTAPTMRADGSLLQVSGYDPDSCLVYDPCGIEFPPVPDSPTLEEARAAAERILAIVRHFSFVSDGARSVWLASLLTAMLRPILPAAPMFVFDAPTRGSGKSKLANVVGMIATGRPPATMSLVDDIDETRKRILALLIQGAPVINIDNVDVPIGGATLCSVLTESTFSDRILGASEIVRVPTTSTWIATGNNVAIAGDLTRRVLIARLDPGCERPEDRSFDFDPVAIAQQNRPAFVVDGLTILRAHVVAGRPQCGVGPFGSFELWSAIIRAAIVWIGLADPIAGRQAVVEQDGGTGAVSDLLRVWHTALGDREITTRQLLASATPELIDAIDEVVGSDVAQANRGRRLGQALAQWRDRIVGGRQAVRGRDAQGGTSRWKVVPADRGGNGGNSGNPGATRASFPETENTEDNGSTGKSRRISAEVPTVPTVPTVQPPPDEAPLDYPPGWGTPGKEGDYGTGSPDDGIPEQPGGKRPGRSGIGGRS